MSERTHSALNAFLQGRREVSLPLELHISGKSYHCTQVLRLLPARRLVLQAEAEGGSKSLIKLFVKSAKGRHEFHRELTGYQLAQRAGISVPAMLDKTEDGPDCYALIYQFIENASAYSLRGDVSQKLQDLCRLIAEMHQKGIYQEDIHLDNFLLTEEGLVLIDLGSVKAETPGKALSKKRSLLNLAGLIAQFDLKARKALAPLLQYYYQQRGWQYGLSEQTRFEQVLEQVWQKRKRHYLSKCFRDCSMTVYHKDFEWEYAFRRDFWDDWQPESMAAIETLFDGADVLKAGNSATVIRRELAGRQVVIKRYNIKNIWHAFRRCFRPSRAAQSWSNANLLEFIGIPTVTPLGFVEKRRGWFRSTAFFISEYQPAEELLDVYSQREPSDREMEQIRDMFASLAHCQIGHGDMKAQNFLVNKEGDIFLIDLDAMKEYRSRWCSRKAHLADKKRFLRNWPTGPLSHRLSSLIQ